jgi:hypothetical protein
MKFNEGDFSKGMPLERKCIFMAGNAFVVFIFAWKQHHYEHHYVYFFSSQLLDMANKHVPHSMTKFIDFSFGFITSAQMCTFKSHCKKMEQTIDDVIEILKKKSIKSC